MSGTNNIYPYPYIDVNSYELPTRAGGPIAREMGIF